MSWSGRYRPRARMANSSMLFPFDGGWRLRSNVIDNAVDLAYLVDKSIGDARQQLLREPRPICRHKVARSDCAHGNHIGVGALIAHDADALQGRQNGECLSQFAIDASQPNLVGDYLIRRP